jgi:hypothetical protein
MRSLAMVFLCGSLAAGVAKAGAPSFQVTIDAPAAKVGATAQARVKVTAGDGYHVNKDYPTSLKITAPPSGVDLPKATVTKGNGVTIEEKQALFEIAYTAKEPGKKTFTGEVKFAVCTETTCDPKKEKVSFTVDVK